MQQGRSRSKQESSVMGWRRLRVIALAGLLVPQGLGGQTAAAPQGTPQNAGAAGQKGNTPPASPSISNTVMGLPPEPQANDTQPLFMRPGSRDFTRPRGYFPNPIAPYTATTAEPPRFTNTLRLNDLIHNGRFYLSLSNAIILTLENNFDIAIQRYNLDIADTDLLRAKSGATLLGVNAGIVTPAAPAPVQAARPPDQPGSRSPPTAAAPYRRRSTPPSPARSSCSASSFQS
jgi:outer membrane protein